MCRRAGASGRASSVDEHLRLVAAGGRTRPWTVERVYQTFPRLAERRTNGGAQLSGGEQQMLAIGARAAQQSAAPGHGRADRRARAGDRRAGRDMLVASAREGEMAVLVVEQNIGVATACRRSGRASWSMAASIGSWTRASSPPTANCSSACSASAGSEEDDAAQSRAAGESVEALMAEVYRVERGERRQRRPSARPLRHVRAANRACRTAGRCRSASLRKSTVEAADAGRRSRQRIRDSVRRTDRPHRPRRRHLRHQGPRTANSSATALRALGIPHAHGRPVDVGQAVQGRCARRCRWRACIRAARRPSFRRSRPVGRPPWPKRSRAGWRASRASAASSRPAARAARHWRPPACARCRSASRR